MSTPGNPEDPAHSSAANQAAARPNESDAPPGVAEQERDLARTREQLGETVDALEAKLDVKSRATQQVRTGRDKVRQAARRTHEAATDRRGKPVPAVWAGIGAVPVVAGAVVGVVLKLRSRRTPQSRYPRPPQGRRPGPHQRRRR